MRPLRPFCGTVLKAQLLTLPATISTSAKGVVTTQLSFFPPASSNATEVLASSESRPATVQPPEPPPTTTKSNVSVTRFPPDRCYHAPAGSRRCERRSEDRMSLFLRRRLALDASARVTRIGRAEPHARRASHERSYRSFCGF